MAPTLVLEGKIQILGQTANSVIYAVACDSQTGKAKDSPSVLKGGTVWYEGRKVLGLGKDAEESDERARKEARIYGVLGFLHISALRRPPAACRRRRYLWPGRFV